MASGKETSPTDAAAQNTKSAKAADQPQWADGLKQLYDSVVEEPLPDSFKDLLSQLDAADADDANQNGNG